jgi:hypothetical protein
MSTYILPCPYSAFSRLYFCVFVLLLFVAFFTCMPAQASAGLELACFPITRSESTVLVPTKLGVVGKAE